MKLSGRLYRSSPQPKEAEMIEEELSNLLNQIWEY